MCLTIYLFLVLDVFNTFSLKSLRLLGLNKIHTIPGNLFQHSQNLVIVELQFNRIQTFHQFVLNYLVSHVQLLTHANPIACDCQVLPLLKWLIDSEMSLEDFPKCQSPEEVQNQSIYYVKLPVDCPHSTRMPDSTNVTPTSYASLPRDYDTLYVTLIGGAFIVILICCLSLYLCIVRRVGYHGNRLNGSFRK
ncbi:Leucine-rich repeat-containing protein 15 [Holothuria leucospilota]|uniref:Leucine-rich repeat-containing protein 15 n=1 Tax=Holothuria leucospilota TaxID=206669 RepID=A0A9Q1HKQ2_HOLLE|nr:Leucine-rich repeat-containing protein 15 [Holothuria leucospilota]